MAIARNLLGSLASTSNITGPYTVAGDNNPIGGSDSVIVVYVTTNGGLQDPTLSGHGLTFTKMVSVDHGTAVRFLVYAALGNGATNTKVSATFGAALTGCEISVVEFTGVDTSGGLAASFDQTWKTSSGTATGATVSLDALQSSDNRPFAGFERPSNNTNTVNTGYDALHPSLQHASPSHVTGTVWDADAAGTAPGIGFNGDTDAYRGIGNAVKAAAGGRTGTGAAQLAPLTASGSGDVAVTGSGAAQLSPLLASGAGTVADPGTSGSGSVGTAALSASGSGEVAVAGTGAAQLAASLASGSGSVEVTGTGSPALAPLDADGTGEADVTGAGAAQLAALSASGSGSVDVTGSGVLDLAALEAAGSGAVDVTGSGSVGLAPLTVQGAGGSELPGITGSGSASLDPLEAQGAGVVDLTGSGDAALGALLAQGSGVVDVTGSGAPALAAAGVAGAGAVDITGAGAAQLAALVAAGVGTQAVPQDEWWAYPPDAWVIDNAGSWGIGPAETKWEVRT